VKDLIISLMVIVGGPVLYIAYRYGNYDELFNGRDIRNLMMILIYIFLGLKALAYLIKRKSEKCSIIIDNYSEYILIIPVIYFFFFMLTS